MKLSSIITGIIFLGAFLLAPVRSSQAAEIININYKYKIAFADLTEKQVKAGDIVTVVAPDGAKAQLKVMETYPVMVKLSVTEGEGALNDEQFAAIQVGSQVVTGDKSGKVVRSARVTEKVVKAPAPAAAADDTPTDVESYSPGAATGAVPKATLDDPVQTNRAAPVGLSAVSVARAATSGTETALPVSAAPVITAASTPGEAARCQMLEQRLDQMLNNNVKLADSITQILADKNAAAVLARDKDSEVSSTRNRVAELSAANTALTARVRELETALTAAQQDGSAKQKEIENLNLKLGELKKKLAKMVEIVNTNMKAYEK
ncbi:MAG: hypothetical protein HGA80_07380 [Candidatus Omnitrophica bacterium]|nr:hypothetical protein [Candidatus Omnitrophota bacterium]